MSTPSERTKLTVVYLTASERHLVRSALDVIAKQLCSPVQDGPPVEFSKLHTIETIEETAALFLDRATPTQGESL